ncbi:MAG: Glu/Leu/Phe/Val family dehydrogenase, partial [bacterium]
FEKLSLYKHELVAFGWKDKVKAIIAVHSTKLGPACGGIRMWNYHSEEDALRDVLRLSVAMTLKNAAAGLNLGGGKCVVIGDPNKDKNEELLLSLGDFVQSLGGTYITAEDIGITSEDLAIISRRTRYVVGLPESLGGMGDCSPYTALGVFHSIKTALDFLYGSPSLEGRTIAIQGLGKVGGNLAKLLLSEGARVLGSDVSNEKNESAKRLGVDIIPPEEILFTPCDVLAPCARGGIINKETIPKLRCKIICGAANNQLEKDDDAWLLEEKGILYIPDFIANAGGIISLSVEMEGKFSKEIAEERVKRVGERVQELLRIHAEEKITTLEAGLRMALARLQEG